MANPKRASMREAPRAALFRKTEGEDGEATPASEPASAPEAATPAAAATPHPRESGLPHPALRASSTKTDQDAARGDSTVPTPRERLRHAFSSEIPSNVMD